MKHLQPTAPRTPLRLVKPASTNVPPDCVHETTSTVGLTTGRVTIRVRHLARPDRIEIAVRSALTKDRFIGYDERPWTSPADELIAHVAVGARLLDCDEQAPRLAVDREPVRSARLAESMRGGRRAA